jgi:A-factor biosynthesis repeat.
MEENLIVVGERFAGFAEQDDVVSVEQFASWLKARCAEPELDRVNVVLGQGVSDYELEAMRSELAGSGLQDKVTINVPEVRGLGRHQVHKHRQSNVLIADLVQEGDEYRASLLIHNDNELLIDHQTGLHVQGMVVIEAARQMFLAVSETFLIGPHEGRGYYYVINTLNTTFENFLFPLAAQVVLRVVSISGERSKRVEVDCEVELFQAGRRCSVVRVTFTAFPRERMEPKETERARRAIEVVLVGTNQTGTNRTGVKPTETNPSGTTRNGAKLAETKPSEIKLFEIKSVETNSDKTDLAKTNPSETNPAETNLASANQSGTEQEVARG